MYLITLPDSIGRNKHHSCTCQDFIRWKSTGTHKCKHLHAAIRARANSYAKARQLSFERMSSLGAATDEFADLPNDPEEVVDFEDPFLQAEWDTMGPALDELLTPLDPQGFLTASNVLLPVVHSPPSIPISPERKDVPNCLMALGLTPDQANAATRKLDRPKLLNELMKALKRSHPESESAVSISDQNKSRKRLPNVGTTTNMRPNMNKKPKKPKKAAPAKKAVVEVDLGILSGLEKLLKFNNSGGEVLATGAEIICLD